MSNVIDVVRVRREKVSRRSLLLVGLSVITALFLMSQTIGVVFAAATITVVKSVSAGPYEIGGEWTYKLQYSCFSLTDTHCNNMQLVDVLPSGIEYVSGSAGVHPATFNDASGDSHCILY